MGGSQSNMNVFAGGQKKKIVIVGASFGGHHMTSNLLKLDPKETMFEILLIDKNEHFEFICSNYQSYSDEESFKKNAIMFNEAVKSYESSRVSYKQAKLTCVQNDKNEIEVSLPDGSVESIPYDVLIISTGASYVSPWRGPDECLTLAQREAEVAQVRADIKAAPSILCVGAGDTGLETVSWLKEAFPDKKVGVCQRGQKLKPAFEGAHQVLLTTLQKMGVEVHLGAAYSEENKLGYDYVLDCRGFKYLGPSEYMQGAMAECVDKKTGQIWVDLKGRVCNKHPIASNHKPENLTLHKNIFSIGDVCLTPRNEVKCIVSIIQYIGQVSNNVAQTCCEGTNFQDIPENMHKLSMTPLGKNGGLFCFNKMVAAKNDAHKMKEELRDVSMGVFRNEKKWKDKNVKNQKDNAGFFGMAQGCCVCLPMHVNKIKGENAANYAKAKAEFEKQYA